MGNLFFVFTPLQLFVSQQIIRQENLKHNVILYGWHNKFESVFDMMELEELWDKKYYMENLGGWYEGLFSFSGARKVRQNYHYIKDILTENHLDTIYLGEVLDQSFRFTNLVFRKQGYMICFYEEGTSHYINRPYQEDLSWKAKCKEWLMDALYFKPLYGVNFAKWHCTPNRPYQGELPMDKRFSMIPFYNEPFDVRLTVEPMLSPKLKAYVESNITEENEHRVMLMTDPLRELMEQKDLYIYFDTIRKTIEQLPADVTLYLKFHPREIESSRKRILEIAQQSGVRFKVLSEEVNICVEYYLQRFHFEKIYFFNAATYFYNGYAFPRTEFVKLMPVVYQKAKAAGVGNLIYMENMLAMITTFEK